MASKVGKAKGGVALLDRKGTVKYAKGDGPIPVARSAIPPPSQPSPSAVREPRWKTKLQPEEKMAWQNKRRGF